jgi:hypothetical protein
MKRAAIIVSAALLASSPLSAQNEEAVEPAFSAEEDLDCAMYVGALMAEMEVEMTPDNRVGLTSAFTYFTGRYEAQRGLGLTEAFTERYPIYQQSNPAEIAQTCSVRMSAFGIRLQEAGRALTRLSPRQPVEELDQDAEAATEE